MDINDLANRLEESQDEGIKIGILMTKIQIVKWLLDKDHDYLDNNKIALYVLNANIEDGQRIYTCSNDTITHVSNKL